MKKEILPLIGMHCSSCKNLIEKKLSKVDGIHNISVNYGSEKVTIEYDENMINKEDIKNHISHLGKYNLVTENSMHHSHEQHAQMLKDEELKKLRTRVTVAGVIAIFFFFTMIYMLLLPVFNLSDLAMLLGSVSLGSSLNYSINIYLLVQFILSSVVVFYSGKDILESAYTAMKVKTTNMDTLISVGTLVAWLYSTILTFLPNVFSSLGNASDVYFEATVFIFFFILLGRYLENNAKGKANNSIQELIKLQVKDAVIFKDGKEIKIPVENLKIGDIVIVRPGEKIAIDGEIVEGSGVIDQSMISGEPIPVEKNIGDKVIGSTLCVSGSFKFKVNKKGSETLLSQIIEKVQEAQASQAPIQKLVDKVSSIFIPVVFLISIASFMFWLSFGTYLGISSANSIQFAIYVFITVLIIACPCALGLATPMAIIAGTGLGAKEGILIKNA
ncbi:MAG TPA: heavy metal translocating P-type ATPase, partial [Candidatus Dojkabacteria bacterium]|nr:heavy metal translocating P-type ATPase [Candidatus Dojkabacteria bacterium]